MGEVDKTEVKQEAATEFVVDAKINKLISIILFRYFLLLAKPAEDLANLRNLSVSVKLVVLS